MLYAVPAEVTFCLFKFYITQARFILLIVNVQDAFEVLISYHKNIYFVVRLHFNIGNTK